MYFQRNLKETIMSQEDVKEEMRFRPEVGLRLWQQSGTRMMRVNERLMHGMTDVANCQMEVGQTLLQHFLDALQSAPNNGFSPDFARVHLEQHRKRVEHTTAAMQKAVHTITMCFGEAAQELLQNEAADRNSTSQIGDKPRTAPK
jgi:hypothetical protein